MLTFCIAFVITFIEINYILSLKIIIRRIEHEENSCRCVVFGDGSINYRL